MFRRLHGSPENLAASLEQLVALPTEAVNCRAVMLAQAGTLREGSNEELQAKPGRGLCVIFIYVVLGEKPPEH